MSGWFNDRLLPGNYTDRQQHIYLWGVVIILSILSGTTVYWILTSLLWAWVTWIIICCVCGYIIQRNFSSIIPSYLLQRIQTKIHSV